MHYNEMELKAIVEMRKEKFEKAALAHRYSKNKNGITTFLTIFKKKNIPKTHCCEMNISSECCA